MHYRNWYVSSAESHIEDKSISSKTYRPAFVIFLARIIIIIIIIIILNLLSPISYQAGVFW